MIIGQAIEDGKLECDLPALVDARLLIQANSGGGKSWLLRLIAEREAFRQSCSTVRASLPACVRRWTCCWSERAASCRPIPTTRRCSRRLIEYKVSAVIDPYELLAERRQFVKLFLDSLIHLPCELWRPTLVLLDEAHIYCPERAREMRNRRSLLSA